MTIEEIIAYIMHTPENTNPAILREQLNSIASDENAEVDALPSDLVIINIDVTIILNGWYGDTSRMYYVGHPSVKAKRLVQTTYETMMAGIMAVKPGATTGDLGAAMQSVAESNGYSVVRDYCGHGCGGVFHGAPNILNFGRKGSGVKLVKGMVFTVEPMVNVGTFETMTLKDDWTVVTKDKQLSAQFEHMVAVTDEGVEILTLSPRGWNFPPYSEE